jgi:hypothetical protein
MFNFFHLPIFLIVFSVFCLIDSVDAQSTNILDQNEHVERTANKSVQKPLSSKHISYVFSSDDIEKMFLEKGRLLYIVKDLNLDLQAIDKYIFSEGYESIIPDTKKLLLFSKKYFDALAQKYFEPMSAILNRLNEACLEASKS